MKEKYPAVVGEVLGNVSSGVILAVLHNLLKENISIRNMVSILESLADNIERVKDPVLLTELVRQRLGRHGRQPGESPLEIFAKIKRGDI